MFYVQYTIKWIQAESLPVPFDIREENLGTRCCLITGCYPLDISTSFLSGSLKLIIPDQQARWLVDVFWNSVAKIQYLFLKKRRSVQRITVINYDRDLLSLALFAGVFYKTSYNPFRKKYFLLSKNSIS